MSSPLRYGAIILGCLGAVGAARFVLARADANPTVERGAPGKSGPASAEPANTAPAPASKPGPGPVVPSWPPVKGQAFPDLTLYDREGRLVSLSSFRGKIIVLEPVGMNCLACNAFSGANQVGGFEDVEPQADLAPLEQFFSADSTGATLDDPRIVWVQLLLYNMKMQAPTVDDLKRWTAHFPAVRKPNCVVLAGTPGMIGAASYAMIPGVQLIDRQFVLRSDFRGHGGGDSLNSHLFPLVRELINHPGQ